MRQRFITARVCITALLVILLSLCLAFGVAFALSLAVYADGDDVESGESGGADEDVEEEPENHWTIEPSIIGWVEGEFDSSVNKISARAMYGNDTVYFRIFAYQTYMLDGNETIYFAPIIFDESIDLDGQQNNTGFRTDANGVVPDYVAETLRGFDADEYYLLAIVHETDDYPGINDSLMQETDIIEASYHFKVLKRTEITSLSIVEWEYGKFNYRTNLISVDITEGDSLMVSYTVQNADSQSIRELIGFYVNEFGEVLETSVRTAFEELVAGNYFLIASTNDPDTAWDTLKIPFTVAKHSNSWLNSPNIVEWTWGEYNLNVNLISPARAQYNDSGAVYYGIYTDETTEYNDVLAKFSVNEDGIVSEQVANELKNLNAGTYYLKCWIENDAENYADISELIEFTVEQIHNSWVVTPSVLSWKYGEFDRELNIIRSEAEFGTLTQYAIHKDEDCTEAVEFNGGKWFALDNDGLVPEAVEAVLKTVDAGTYYITVLVTNDNPNYGVLSETIPFVVLKVQNSWVEAPSIISWNEGHFDVEDNVLNGIAKAGQVKFTVLDEKDNLLYTIIKNSDGAIISVTNANGDSMHISVLNKLSVGSYKLVAEVESTENYTTLKTTAYFAVFEDSVALSGIIAAAITFGIIDLIAAGLCITLLIIRRRKVESQFRKMVRKELNRR